MSVIAIVDFPLTFVLLSQFFEEGVTDGLTNGSFDLLTNPVIEIYARSRIFAKPIPTDPHRSPQIPTSDDVRPEILVVLAPNPNFLKDGTAKVDERFHDVPTTGFGGPPEDGTTLDVDGLHRSTQMDQSLEYTGVRRIQDSG